MESAPPPRQLFWSGDVAAFSVGAYRMVLPEALTSQRTPSYCRRIFRLSHNLDAMVESHQGCTEPLPFSVSRAPSSPRSVADRGAGHLPSRHEPPAFSVPQLWPRPRDVKSATPAAE